MPCSIPAHPDRAGVPVTPIDHWLESQTVLQTPVAEFARLHTDAEFHSGAQVRRLLPLETPKAGEQYAFDVDLDRCFGCKACVAACHSLNGLDETESWRDVGYIHQPTAGTHYHQTVTSACHHCVDPACLNGCPVEAYEKDPLTGIVLHLDDQCIGCSYCILKCPYDVPKFNKRLGIVRKCDLCHGRLKSGEAPACAQACPTQAISVTIVKQAEVRDLANASTFLPGAPNPSLTQPTTRYHSARPVPSDATAADAHVAVKAHAHWPLILLLVCTQASVGVMAAGTWVAEHAQSSFWAALAFAGIGILASVLHLGQPLRAWRVFLGLRRSWLSREIVGFGAYGFLLTCTLASGWVPQLSPAVQQSLSVAACITGCIAVFTSVMIYADTGRRAWNFRETFRRFAGTVLLTFFLVVGITSGDSTWFVATWFLAGAKCLWDALDMGACHSTSDSSHGARFPWFSTRAGKLALALRITLLFAAIAATLWQPATAVFIGIAGGALLLGELCERYQFFVSVNVSKMPGGAVR